MKILVLGAGGLGGYFGGRLAQGGADVTFLVRPKRGAQLERDGLVIESPSGNARLQVKTVLAGDVKPGYDWILFTCKAYDLDSAMDAVAPAMRGGGCALLPVLNGFAHFEALDARFGAAQVLGGTAHINAVMRADGVIVNGDPLNRILFGERDGAKSARIQAIADAFARTTVEWRLSEDIVQDLWEKVTFLCTLASATCLFRGNIGEIMAAPGGKEAVLRAYEANVQIAAREGHAPRAAHVESGRARLTDPKGTWTASMLRDLEAGGRTEADHIVGWMLERARRHGVDDTILSLAFTHLKAYEARRNAGRLSTLVS
jgi:2-dehydropantoate 2-reductase